MQDTPTPNTPAPKAKTALDKDLKKIARVEAAAQAQGMVMARIGMATLFLLAVWIFTSMQTGIGFSPFVVAAAVIGGYMAMNIGCQRRCQQCRSGGGLAGVDPDGGHSYCGGV